MTLVAGIRLGPYEILGSLGAGGMGEVYRARDSKLHRDVAIKILPERFVTDDDRVARFEREAQALAALSHPNIAIIHGFEESNDVKALVLELVEGPTLADRIALGPIPIDEALPIAQQIGAACEAAHAQGVIHRDLKPSNIKLRPDGTVKVLDFGLAKLVTDESDHRGVSAIAALSQSPTLTTPASTLAGVILGTAAYMAPEQARGKKVDKRADIWAFGCVLFEMLTGTRAFRGDEIADTLAFIITKEPNWSALPRGVPPAVQRVLRRCLQKDPGERLRDIGDARIELKEALTEPAGQITSTRFEPRSSVWRRVLTAAVVVAAVSLVTAAAMWLAMRPGAPRVTRTTISPSGAVALSVASQGRGRDLAITADGTRIVYIGVVAGQPQLFVRALDQLEATPLPGLGTPNGVFLSPDGQWIGFFDGTTSTLKKVAITGGPAVTVCRLDGIPVGGTWDTDETIVFATSNVGSGLLQVSAAGGEPTVLTRPNREHGEADHAFPRALPDGRGILFTIVTSTLATNRAEGAQVAVFDRGTATQKILVRGGSDAHYVAGGHLIYNATGTLRASAFDLDRMEPVGATIPVVPQVAGATGIGQFDVSRDGTLIYLSGSSQSTRLRTLAWVDRQGHEQLVSAPPRAYTYPRISPDGTHIALDIRDQENDIWVWNLARETLTRLTFDATPDRYPVWTPDSKRVVFGGDRAGATNLFQQTADGTGPAERLSQSSQVQFPDAISPDGARVVLEELSQTGGRDLMMLAAGGGASKIEPLVRSSFVHLNADISPDGRWLAYESNESGRFEIYVRPFPNVNGGRWQVSTGGGTKPVWARKGKELFYVAPPGRIMSVPVDGGSAWLAGTPTKVLEGPYFLGGPNISGRTYDVSADGQRFLMIKFDSSAEQGAVPTSLVVVQNWVEELKRLVPRK